MTLEGLNFNEERDSSGQVVENTRFSEGTLQRIRTYLSRGAVENTVSATPIAVNEANGHNDKE